MRIAIFNKKGGVGKTALSVALFNDLNCKVYFSNEDNKIRNLDIHLLNFKTQREKEELIIPDDCIFDFGGFADDISDYLKICNLIIVPTTKDILSLQNAYRSLKTIEKINNRILLVMTKTSPRYAEQIEQKSGRISKDFPYRWFFLNESKIFDDVINENKGILELKERFCYKSKTIIEQWSNFLKYIDQYKKFQVG